MEIAKSFQTNPEEIAELLAFKTKFYRYSLRNTMMIYSYDKLWKLLIDRKITKTEMRQQTGISTNMLAKMGKQMPVSMEALAKICNYLGCGLDDVVEIFSFTEEGGDR